MTFKIDEYGSGNHFKGESIFTITLLLLLAFFNLFLDVSTFEISLYHTLISSEYLHLLRRGLSLFVIIFLHQVSSYIHSKPFQVMMRIFFSSLDIISRRPLFFHFCPIPFELNTSRAMSLRACHFRWGKITTTAWSQVFTYIFLAIRSYWIWTFLDITQEKSFT